MEWVKKMSLISVKNLVKIYRTGATEVRALRGLNLEVNEGEVIAIMGPSGCGKTTLLNILGGLDTPTSGECIVDGIDLLNISEEELVLYRREKVGLVFQFFNLVPTLTAEENIELPMRLAEKPASERVERTMELLQLVGMYERGSHKPDELSGGEQQRIAIAVALANNPKIILADEPTGELDKKNGEEILALFRMLKERYGKTLIIVTHDQRVTRFADITVHIEDGRILETIVSEDYVPVQEVKKETEKRQQAANQIKKDFSIADGKDKEEAGGTTYSSLQVYGADKKLKKEMKK